MKDDIFTEFHVNIDSSLESFRIYELNIFFLIQSHLKIAIGHEST